jgi:hypothetical protein
LAVTPVAAVLRQALPCINFDGGCPGRLLDHRVIRSVVARDQSPRRFFAFEILSVASRREPLRSVPSVRFSPLQVAGLYNPARFFDEGCSAGVRFDDGGLTGFRFDESGLDDAIP